MLIKMDYYQNQSQQYLEIKLMNRQDDQQSDIFNQEPRLSQWFRTNDSKVIPKSQMFGSSIDQVLQPNEFNYRLEFQHQNWNIEDFNKKAARKQQNRESSKRARLKKKQDYEKMKQRIEELERENSILREKKVCSWCKRSLQGVHQHYAQICTNVANQTKNAKQNTQKQLVFQEIKEIKPRRAWNPKVWVALGILMLVVGLQLFGYSAEQKPIKIRESDMQKWAQRIYEEGPGTINIKMKNKVMNVDSEKSVVKQPWKQKTNWLQRIRIENEEDYQMDQQQQIEETQLNIDKDLLFSIQAQFDDIGRYI